MENINLGNTINLLLVLVISFPLHELSHAVVATILGDSTPRLQGRLTLNPLAHLDLLGSLSMIFLGIGWAKPVETRLYFDGFNRYKIALIAFAGPLANVLLAFSLIPLLTVSNSYSFTGISTILYNFILINCYLFVLNLLPIPPFDGFKIAQSLQPNSALQFISNKPWLSFAILAVLVYTGLLQGITSYLSIILMSIIS